MLYKTKARPKKFGAVEPFVARQSGWVRAPESGFVSHQKQLGDYVEKGECLAIIKDPFGATLDEILSNAKGIIIGKQNIPLVQAGEAVYHIAYFTKPDDVVGSIENMQDVLIPEDELQD